MPMTNREIVMTSFVVLIEFKQYMFVLFLNRKLKVLKKEICPFDFYLRIKQRIV